MYFHVYFVKKKAFLWDVIWLSRPSGSSQLFILSHVNHFVKSWPCSNTCSDLDRCLKYLMQVQQVQTEVVSLGKTVKGTIADFYDAYVSDIVHTVSLIHVYLTKEQWWKKSSDFFSKSTDTGATYFANHIRLVVK